MALGNDSGYDEDDILSVKNVQCINMATGEVLEWDVSTDTAMAMAYDEITQFEGALKRAKEKIKKRAIARMGMDDTLDISLQYQFARTTRAQSYEYDKAELRKWFDEDAFDTITKVDTKKADTLIKEYVEAGALSADEAKAIRECKQATAYSEVFKLNILAR